jgi:hypothetical protein
MFSSVDLLDEYMSENTAFRLQDFYKNIIIWLKENAHNRNLQWIKIAPLRSAILTTDVGVRLQ